MIPFRVGEYGQSVAGLFQLPIRLKCPVFRFIDRNCIRLHRADEVALWGTAAQFGDELFSPLIEWDHNRTGSLPDQLERSCNLSKGKTVCGHTRFQFAADIFYIQAIVPGDLIKPGEVGVNRLEGKGIGMLLEDITCQFSRTPQGV